MVTALIQNLWHQVRSITGKYSSIVDRRFESFAQSDARLAAVVFGLVILANYIVAPSLGIHAELWAETATNYLQYGLSDDFVANMRRTDAGYLVLFPRFVAFFLTRFDWTVALFPFLAQAAAHVSVAAFSALISHRRYNPFVTPEFHRFVLALLIGLYPGYELHTYVNFVYLAFPLLTLSALWDLRQFNTIERIATLCVLPLLIGSKGIYIIFLPIFLMRLVFDALKKRGWINLSFALLVVLVLFWQLKVMLEGSSGHGKFHLDAVWGFLSEWLPYYFHLAGALFFRRPPILLSIALDIAIITWFLWKLVRLYNSDGLFSKNMSLVGLLLYLGVGTLFINFVSVSIVPAIPKMSVHFWDVGDPQLERQYFPTNITMIFLLLFLFEGAGRILRKTFPFLLILLILRCDYLHLSKREFYPDPQQSFSNWQYFRHKLHDSLAFIPVNPYPWHMIRQGKVIQTEAIRADSGRYEVHWTGKASTLVLTFDTVCSGLNFSDLKGKPIQVTEISSPVSGADNLRRHRFFSTGVLPVDLQSLRVQCVNSATAGTLKVLIHVLPAS